MSHMYLNVWMSTKADLLTAWTKWTGDDVAEVRHRIRALSEAGLLPRRKQPLEYSDIARTLIGFTANTQHKDAPDAVRMYSNFVCNSVRSVRGKPTSANAAAFSELTLEEALVRSLQPPFRLLKFEVNQRAWICTLMIGEGHRRIVSKSGKPTTAPDGVFSCEFEFMKHPLTSPHIYLQVNRSTFVVFPLVDMLLTDLMGHPKPQYAGGPYAGGPYTKGAALPGATPHVEPSEPRLKADPAGSSPDSSDSTEWVWPPQFNDPYGVYHGPLH